ncbi:unnamed protein product [Euphydryas editha]|uniref:Uncharacterized protein n=1 Tax=Euphydryas editha TaxID=104508 RepID=A0AAU9VBA6_EUPED|nr:unnamed protein product [Euphydryas editha]
MIKQYRLKVGFLNPGSLGTKHDEFLVAMSLHNVDIMAINETWLKTDIVRQKPKSMRSFYRPIKEIDSSKLEELLSSKSWDQFSNSHDVNEMVADLNKIIILIFLTGWHR